MSITSFLDIQQRESSISTGSPFGSVDMEQQFMRFESAMSDLTKVREFLGNISGVTSISDEEGRFSKIMLDRYSNHAPKIEIRMEAYSANPYRKETLIYRAEGIVNTIIEKISAFFRWIGGLFTSESAAAAGGAAASAAVEATSEAVATASGSGKDEFLFKESHSLFKVMDLTNLTKCREYYQAVAASTKALVEINKKSIELSKNASKEFQGDFVREMVSQLKSFAAPKTPRYASNIVGTALPSGTYFAYPVKFLEAKAIVFEENKIVAADKAFVGEGYTPKDTYVSYRDWKNLVDSFGASGKDFYDSMKALKSVGEDYEKLADAAKSWKEQSPETVKLVGEGIRQLNACASLTYRLVKEERVRMDTLFKSLQNVAENDLRSSAEQKRKQEAEEAEKLAKGAVTTGVPAPAVP